MKHWLFAGPKVGVLVALAFQSAALAAPASTPSPSPKLQAHSHNDYLQKRPLLDALDQGFCSVEADIFLVDGLLLVGHDTSELRPHRTLEALYLKPLRERVLRNGGRVYPQGPEFHLLIDIKQNGASLYQTLSGLLENYQSLLTRFEENRTFTNAISITLSGDRPKEKMLAQKVRWVSFDGRVPDLESNLSPHFMRIVSDNWNHHFKWKGLGEFPAAEREKLRQLVARTHAQGRQIRFWAAPDNPMGWREFVDSGVDLINTDHLKELSEFLARNR